jgi:hypothetical protein
MMSRRGSFGIVLLTQMRTWEVGARRAVRKHANTAFLFSPRGRIGLSPEAHREPAGTTGARSARSWEPGVAPVGLAFAYGH